MTLRTLDHIQLAMPRGRETEARAFYSALLGLPEVAKPPELAKRGGAWFERGALRVHLGVEEDFRPARKAHPAFVVDDLAALAERLKAAGYPVTPDDQGDPRPRFFTADPFGNRIELIGG